MLDIQRVREKAANTGQAVTLVITVPIAKAQEIGVRLWMATINNY